MTDRPVCLVGGAGFLGGHVASRLAAVDVPLRVPTRNRERAKASLILLPAADVRRLDVHDDRDLATAIDGAAAVVNLVGVLHDARGDGFERNHVALPARLARACRAAGVKRLVHVSAVGVAENAPSAYLRSKAQGERALREAAGDALELAVLRPSVIFGRGDRFLNLFAELAALFPVLPLAGADARFQPVWVEDVARVIVDAATRATPPDPGPVELCGPREYALAELVRYVCAQRGLRRPILPLPGPVATLQAFVLEHLPGRVMTRDNLRSMQVPNVCGCRFEDVAGFAPTALEAVAPTWLAPHATPRGRYPGLRVRTRR
jgi:NADH dehydrogenase